jgi:octaprenyl-diphosphate synthase
MVATDSLRVLDILSNAAATIAEGEVLQLTAARNLATDEDVYLQVVRGKTAALFAAACEVGAVIAGRPEPEVEALRVYGDALGVSFQIVDDLLDYGGDAGKTGKNVGDDFRERKLTLPIIKAVALADRDERAFWARTIEKGDQRDGDLEHALALLRRHGTLAATREAALAWAARARAALAPLPEHELKGLFAELSDYVVARVT